jgi:hypothetical protein
MISEPASKNGTTIWRPFVRSYDDAELSVMAFATVEDVYSALDVIVKGALRGMPFGIPGYNSLVVPKDAVHYFTDAGLRFEESKLLRHDELTGEELDAMRKQFIY